MKRTMLAAAVIAAGTVTLAAQPASANIRYAVDQVGSGTWTAAPGGIGFTGTTTGRPVAGSTRGFVQTRDGSMPAPGECEDGSGTISTWSDKAELVLALTAQFCGEYWPEGQITVYAKYVVQSYTGAKIKPGATGTGGVYLRLSADGTAYWEPRGDLKQPAAR